jgi:hypothetical protein
VSGQFPDTDILALVTEGAKKYGIGVNSWTVTLHNSRLAMANPEMAMVNAYGDVDHNFLCPNNKDAREFVIGLTRNLAEKYSLEAIQLESAGYTWGFEHGDHHEMFGTQIEPFTSDLMTTCFCKDCATKMKQEDIDPESLRKLVKSVVDLSMETPANVLQKVPVEETLRNSYVLSTDIEELHQLLRFKRNTVNSFIKDVRDAVKSSNSNVRLRVIIFGGSSGTNLIGRGSEGVDVSGLAGIVDGFDLLEYVPNPEVVYYHVQWTKLEAGNCPIYVALRPAFPVLHTQQGIEEEILAAIQAGASGVEFYNYGWTHLRSLGWVKESLRNATSRLAGPV